MNVGSLCGRSHRNLRCRLRTIHHSQEDRQLDFRIVRLVCNDADHIVSSGDFTLFILGDAQQSATRRIFRLYGTAINPYASAASAVSGGAGFDISWAVDENGVPVPLASVRYVRVYSAVLFNAGIFGETSAEVCGLYVANGTGSSTITNDLAIMDSNEQEVVTSNMGYKEVNAGSYALVSSADRVYLKTENVTGNEEFFALSKIFFRRNTDVFQEKLMQRKKVRCPGALAVGRIHPKICNNAKPEAVSSVSGLFMLMYAQPDWV